jgi:hypothetical protein
VSFAVTSAAKSWLKYRNFPVARPTVKVFDVAMRTFHCCHCGKPVFYENTVCGSCGHLLAYLPDLRVVASLEPAPDRNPAPGKAPPVPLYTTCLRASEGRTYRLCSNYSTHNVCNWAVASDDPNALCMSCRLTQVIPDLGAIVNKVAWYKLEVAKRRLIYSLVELQLPVRNRTEDPAAGLAFKFIADLPSGPRVLTGHDEGVITVSVAEADDLEREKRRLSLHEPYRTLLGHFRHEIGHYYWDRLIKHSPRIDAYRKLFGDERADYGNALKIYYDTGPRPDWNEQFVSGYASMHPWEDWAESWAHYMHMTDTLETAAAVGMSMQPDRKDEPAMPRQAIKPAAQQSFDEIIGNWFPLTYALNCLNRGMGLADAYPFVLGPVVIDKLRFVHETVRIGTKTEK